MSDSNNSGDLDPIARRAIEQSVDSPGTARSANMIFGLIAGVIAAIICAVGWAAFTLGTGIQLGLLAIALGMIVGVAVRVAGSGWDSKFGVMAAILALFGCAFGNYLCVIAVISRSEDLGYMEVIQALGLTGTFGVMTASFGMMDILFYGIAISSAYRLGFRE